MTVTLSHYLILAAVLFSISIAGIVINRKNIIILLMSIELMLLSVNLNFLAFSHYLDDLAGQVLCRRGDDNSDRRRGLRRDGRGRRQIGQSTENRW